MLVQLPCPALYFPVMDGATAAVIGAAIGALGGVSGSWLTALAQRSQRRDDERRWRADIRREAYTDYISTTKQLSAAQWRMAECLWAQDSTPDQWRSAFREVHDAWAAFSTAAAAVTVTGPSAVAHAADALRTAMSDIQNATMDWLTGAHTAGHGRLEESDVRFQAVAKAKQPLDKAFQAAARAALDTEHP
ncbi:hypothetical protein QQY66_34250 [Streptomyces sp. DG2A-72]|uniref:hypothetical protein n=1 Tax=Streptomyces sp. DG2A-72 TaxID=3051386 RepID=UPI00265BF1AD|nr:hypothetical protein [Streptomyces sp. DG2A-72]MDO0936523.1 hypothetical protein [Streptomyces sp. DG2A-72]